MRPLLAGALICALSSAGPTRADQPGEKPARLDPAEVSQRLAGREAKRLLQAQRRASRPSLGASGGHAEAVSCGAPCEAGTLTLDHVFHDILLDCETGAFGIRTGASHPATIAAGAKQDLLFDAAFDNAAGGRTAIYAHEDAAFFDDPGGRQACSFDPPDTAEEPNSLGVEQEWTITPAMGLDLLVRHELVAFGSDPGDSGVRMSLTVTNTAAAGSSTVGMRWWLDPGIALDDGPSVTTVACEPPQEFATWIEEHEFPAGEIEEFLELVNDDVFGTEPVIEYVIGTSPVPGFPASRAPDRLIAARWSNAPDDPPPAWDYAPFEGDPTSDDVVLMLYHGYDQADGTSLGPGESVTLSTLLLSTCDSMSGGGCVAPVLTAEANGSPGCPGDVITLGGGIVAPGLGSYTYTWTFGDGSPPVRVTDPTVPVQHVYTGPDFYRARLTASDGGDPGCSSFATVDVDIQLGPAPTGELTDELRVSRTGGDVQLDWPGSPVAPPSFVALRSDDLASVETTAGWIAAERISFGPPETATDLAAVGSGPLRFYKVFPADPDCGHPVVTPDVFGYQEILRDEMEVESGWIVDPDGDDDATTGIWVREDPNGTNYQPEDDHSPDPGVTAWITGNLPGAGDGDDDVDGGCTTLQSPVFDLAGSGVVRLSYWRTWDIGAAMDDVFLVEISNDGGSAWRELETIDAPTGGWRRASFDLPLVLGEPTDQVVLRFTACDLPNGSFLEAGVDDLVIEEAL